MSSRSKKILELALGGDGQNSVCSSPAGDSAPTLHQTVIDDLEIDFLDENGLVSLTLPNEILHDVELPADGVIAPLSEVFLNETDPSNIAGSSCLDARAMSPKKFGTYPSFATTTDDSDTDFNDENDSVSATSTTSTSQSNTEKTDVEIGSTDGDNEQSFGLKKKKRGNKRQEQKEKRHRGEKYLTYKGEEKKERSVKPHTCSIGRCQNKCQDFDEKTRTTLFKSFWELPYQGQRDFIASNISVREVKRRRVKHSESRKDLTRSYYLPLLNEKVKVCRKFFISTLDVTDKLLRYTETHRNDISVSQTDRRGRHSPKNKTPESLRTDVIDFIKCLPAVPSHYCRKDSTRKYLPSELKNITNLYRLYKTAKESEDKAFVSLAVFKSIFHREFNITFHVPRKDKCLICEQHNTRMGPHTEYETEKFTKHILEKEEIMRQFQQDQSLSKDNSSILCTSFDLQKVLGTPHGDNFLIGFTSRYAVYNLTFYESGTRNVDCFLWGESDGKKGSNEVCSIVVKYLESVDERCKVTDILLYCDNCFGQNKNQQMICAINWFLSKSKNVKQVVLNFLLPGHSYMPVDSVHGTIEQCLKNKVVWASSEWPTIIRNARIKYNPYNVHTLTHKDFFDWKGLQARTFPSSLKSEDKTPIRIRDLRKIIFDKTEPNFVKISTSASNEIFHKVLIKKPNRTLNQNNKIDKAYKARLPIATEKYEGLRKLCTKHVIPDAYHEEYLTLPKKPTVPHCLMETDEEDELKDEED